MEQLRFGVYSYPPYLYLVGKSELKGYLLSTYKAMNYYLWEKFNTTFVSSAPRSGAHCDQYGNCFNSLKDLQLGKVDVQGHYGLYYLSSLPINLSLTSPVMETKCYLFYKPNVHVNLLSEYFFDFVYYFESVFWLLLVILVILFFILFKNLHIFKIKSWWQFVWTIGGTTLGQFSFEPGQLSRRCIYISFLAWLLLIGSIFSASLQTGLKSKIDFIKLDSLEDVIKNNYTTVVIDTVTCRTLFDSTLDNVKRVRERLILLNATNKSPNELFHSTTAPGKLIIDENLQYLRMKHFACCLDRESEITSPIYISKHSVFKVGNVVVYHSKVNRRTAKLIERSSYGAFEMGCLDNHEVRKLGLFSIFDTKETSSCMANHFQGDSIITAPISLYYLMLPAIILYTGHLIALFIFALGHWSNRFFSINC